MDAVTHLAPTAGVVAARDFLGVRRQLDLWLNSRRAFLTRWLGPAHVGGFALGLEGFHGPIFVSNIKVICICEYPVTPGIQKKEQQVSTMQPVTDAAAVPKRIQNGPCLLEVI